MRRATEITTIAALLIGFGLIFGSAIVFVGGEIIENWPYLVHRFEALPLLGKTFAAGWALVGVSFFVAVIFFR